MTDIRRNLVAPYGSFEPIPTNHTPTVSTTSILANYYSQNSALYLTAKKTHEPSTNSDAIPFTSGYARLIRFSFEYKNLTLRLKPII